MGVNYVRRYLHEKADKLEDYEDITESYCAAQLRNYHRGDARRISKVPHITFVRWDFSGDERGLEISMIQRGREPNNVFRGSADIKPIDNSNYSDRSLLRSTISHHG